MKQPNVKADSLNVDFVETVDSSTQAQSKKPSPSEEDQAKLNN